jgi:FADH2 O2-dependent halogenase
MAGLEKLRPDELMGVHLADYGRETFWELDRVAMLVAALYAHMEDFEMFAALTRLYFAAVSFTESIRRLGTPDLAGPRFLLGSHPEFGPRFELCCQQALALSREPSGPSRSHQRSQWLADIRQTLEPVDVAGLNRIERNNWHPALARDLVESNHKLGATREAVIAMLKRCGFH